MALGHRTGLELVPAYKQGKAPEPGAGGGAFKLSSNENPYPPLPSVHRAVVEAAADLNIYPDMAAPELTALVADRFDVPASSIVFGAGSVEVASQLIHAVASPGDEVVFAWRSFEAYPALVRVAGCVPVPVPLDDAGGHDLPAMARAVTGRTRLVFVCNPNNPTGTVTTTAALEEFLAAVPAGVLVVIDEAYVHFNDDPDSPAGVEFFKRYPNVAVLHTFSKAYGLAGLRLGYAIAPAEVAANLRKVAVPFGVTALAQRAGTASLAAEAELQERVDVLIRERRRVHAALVEAGLPVLPSRANFLWIAAGGRTAELNQVLEEHGLAARAFDGEGIRVSIGTPAANDALIRAAAACRNALAESHV
ncbi:histidinol-phosphate transaminase [Arthrobacter mobilis]|uniref:Aromatic amino acid aminotransferase n=1 Tax=Arthrobacter mobilis TaxID=2724944 RepID=A0A7X6K783_9MICC|nr:histidinol-phosphate transaminase [Arthrobacter mobilis]NKX56442.1 histidinol-phosphate transaminase [Arthrobacter mobilis]